MGMAGSKVRFPKPLLHCFRIVGSFAKIAELFRVFDADNDDRVNLIEVRRMFAAADKMKERLHDEQASYYISCIIVTVT
jgi:hypothetical protein